MPSLLHARRPSEGKTPDLAQSPSFFGLPSVSQRRVSKFDMGGTNARRDSTDREAEVSGMGDTAFKRKMVKGGRAGPALEASWVATVAGLGRAARSRRLIALVAVCIFVSLLPRGQVLARTPVPQALLPIIRQSGKMIHRISPAAGQRVKEWHDQRHALTPAGIAQAERDAVPRDHVFHSNGLLVVSKGGRHPIVVLIEEADKAWKAKIAKQSTTLKEAVAEYKVRYRRNPPKGFDQWYVLVFLSRAKRLI